MTFWEGEAARSLLLGSTTLGGLTLDAVKIEDTRVSSSPFPASTENETANDTEVDELCSRRSKPKQRTGQKANAYAVVVFYSPTPLLLNRLLKQEEQEALESCF